MPRVSAAANLVGVVTPMTIVALAIARASALVVPHHPVVGISAVSSQVPCLIRCLSIATIMHAKERDSTVTMPLSMLLGLFLALVLVVIPLPVKEKSRLSSPKPPMKLQEDGQQHQMVHTRGVTAGLENKVAPATTVHQVVSGLVLLVGNISDEAPSKFHTTTTTDLVEEP